MCVKEGGKMVFTYVLYSTEYHQARTSDCRVVKFIDERRL